jgi:hypothetical protein
MDSNDDWLLALTLLGVGITVAWILVGRRLRKLGWTVLIAVSVWAAVWLIGYLVANSDWGNDRLSGWADCHDSCTVWDGVGAWLIFGPPIAGLVAVVAGVVVAAIDRVRSRTKSSPKSRPS